MLQYLNAIWILDSKTIWPPPGGGIPSMIGESGEQEMNLKKAGHRRGK